jgi:hypothetical protein
VKHLFEPVVLDELNGRLSRLRPDSRSHWGKMSVSQMLAHCSEWMDLAQGRTFPPRSLVGYIFGRVAKRSVLNDEPIRRNMPTDKILIVNGERDFAAERERLSVSIGVFSSGGPDKCTRHPHSFFGPMTPQEWAILAYKHLDHHFRQFGV